MSVFFCFVPRTECSTVYTFEDLPDAYFFSGGNQNIGSFYSGLTFGPDVTGLSVSRFGGYDNSGFPPHSGDVSIWDASDATITISFDAPLESFGIWYTTFDPLTLEAFDGSNNSLGVVLGNPNTDGTTGTSSFLSFAGAGIQSVTLTSTPGLFVLDDLTITSETTSVPEPNPCFLIGAIFFVVGVGRYFRGKWSTDHPMKRAAVKARRARTMFSFRACCVAVLLIATLPPLMADSPVVDDTATQYSISKTSYPFPDCGSCDLSPSYNQYRVSASFNITKITFTWVNNGTGNNCDGFGTYVAAISASNNASGILAVSNNNIYLGCSGSTTQSGTGELDFTGQTIPGSFYLDFYSINGLQDGASIIISNVEIWQGTTGTIQVLNNLSSGTSASFTITGPQNLSGSGKSATFNNITPGEYRIVFGALSGNFTPQSQVASLQAGGSITFTGDYLPQGVIQQQQDSSQIANPAAGAVAQVFVAAATGNAQSLTVQDTVGISAITGYSLRLRPPTFTTPTIPRRPTLLVFLRLQIYSPLQPDNLRSRFPRHRDLSRDRPIHG